MRKKKKTHVASAKHSVAAHARPSRSKPTGKNRFGWGIALKSLAALAVVAVLVMAVFWFIEFQRSNEARTALEQAVGNLAKVDQVLLTVDESINSKTTTETVLFTQEITDAFPSTTQELDSIEKSVRDSRTHLRPADREFAETILLATNNRKEMLSIGEKMISLDTSASISLALVEDGWNTMTSAHEKSESATKAANDGTHEGAEKSLKINTEVREQLKEAKDEFGKVKEMFPEADLTVFMDYVEGRLKANSYAIDSDNFVLKGDVNGASKSIEQLNEQNAASAKQLAELEKTPEKALDAEYQRQARVLLDFYSEVKTKTAEIDELIRKQL